MINYPIYKFNDDISEAELFHLDNFNLSKCPFAITILIDKYPEKISKDGISLNPNPLVIEYLKKHPDKINWNFLSSNPNAIEILRENSDKINWSNLSMNNCAFKLLNENQDKIDWSNICYNDNPKIVSEIIDRNLDKNISWFILSKNSSDKAVEILLRPENINKIDYQFLSINSNDKVFDLIEKNLDKIDFDYLITNPNPKIIEIFRENKDKISWYYLSMNTNTYIKEYIFNNFNDDKDNICEISSFNEYMKLALILVETDENDYIYHNWLNSFYTNMYRMDFGRMKSNFQNFEEELIKEVYHPRRVCKWIDAGYDLEDFF